MKTKVYAVAEKVPERRYYLTAGKAYEVIENHDRAFVSRDDTGDDNFFFWQDCSHLDGGDWTRLELPDVDPRDVAALIEVARDVLDNIVRVDVCVPHTLEDRLRAILNKIKGE